MPIRTFLKLAISIFFLSSFFQFASAENARKNQMVEANVAEQTAAFLKWKNTLKPEMLETGASEALVDKIITSLKYIPRVIQLDRRQPEGTMTHEQYLKRVIPRSKITQARKAYANNKDLIDAAAEKTGVSSRIIVALWGKETHFGKVTGNYHVPSALATLAFDGRRAKFFRKELLAAVKILAQGHIDLAEMKGSWAGAMGNCQFMPSSFLRFAVDANGDGKKDIWSDKEDIFASMGNYLAVSGWQSDQTWGRQVKLTRPFAEYKMGKANKQSISNWQTLGVRQYDLTDLPTADMSAYLIAPGGEKGRIYLVYNNFDVLMRWNRSHYFATGVGYLADRLTFPKIP